MEISPLTEDLLNFEPLHSNSQPFAEDGDNERRRAQNVVLHGTWNLDETSLSMDAPNVDPDHLEVVRAKPIIPQFVDIASFDAPDFDGDAASSLLFEATMNNVHSKNRPEVLVFSFSRTRRYHAN